MSAPEYRFSMRFAGRARDEGRIEARELAAAIAGSAGLIDLTARRLLPGAAQVTLEVDAEFREGSFEVLFNLVSWAGEQLAALSVDELETIFTTIFGGGGLIALLRHVRNQKPEDVEERDGTVTYRIGDEAGVVNINVFNLAANRAVVDEVKKLTTGLRRDSTEYLEVTPDGRDEPVLRVAEKEARYLQRPIEVDDLVRVTVSEPVVQVSTVDFVEGRKWKFRQGESEYFAAISDPTFLERVAAGERFASGDLLEVELETRTQLRPGAPPRYDRTILRVIRHIRREDVDQTDLLA